VLIGSPASVQESCPGWAALGECEANSAFMYKNCPATCDICADGACIDSHSNATECKEWAAAGQCIDNPNFMARECSKSCGLCTTVCGDLHESCAGWVKAGECEENPNFMAKQCPSSCGICHDLETSDKDEL